MHRAATAALSLALLLVAAPVAAEDATAQAKALFNAGAQAYEAGQYPAAIQALTEAYRLSPRPGILFSMAQAHRKQYFVDKQPAQLREAVKLYRDYIARVEQGGRRGDAVQALAELDPILERLGALGAGEVAPAPVAVKPATRVSISAQAKEATILLDGKPVEAGIFHDVTAGKHSVRVTAPGYFPEEREIPTAEGGIVAVDVPMREQPALLSVSTFNGADIAVDGRSAALTPLARPIELTPGAHFVAVTKRGYRAYAADIEVNRGEARTLVVPLTLTGQRVSAYVLGGIAAAGILTGGVLAGVALYEEGQAESLNTRRTTQGGLSSTDLSSYLGYVSNRDTYRTASAAVFGAGAAVGLTAVFLAVFDQPIVGGATVRDRVTTPGAPAPIVRERPLDATIAPIVAPGIFGATIGGRF